MVDFSAGLNHSLFLKNDGTVWTTGGNGDGQLGDGTNYHRRSPVQVKEANGSSFDNVTKISAGPSHSLFLKNDGTVWATGNNAYGQLGDGTQENRTNPVQVLNQDGSIFLDVVEIEALNARSIFLKSDGTVWSVGHGQFGQNGDGTLNDSISCADARWEW